MLLAYSNFQNYFCVTILIKNADIINWRRAKGAMFGKQECKRAHKTKTNPETIVNKIQNADTKIQSSSSEFLSLSRHVDASSEGVKNSTKCARSLSLSLSYLRDPSPLHYLSPCLAPTRSFWAAATQQRPTTTETPSYLQTPTFFLLPLFVAFVCRFCRKFSNVFSNLNCRALETDALRSANGESAV